MPVWCNSFTANISGKIYNGITGRSLQINHNWKSGEKINVSFQIPVQILTGRESYPGQFAFQKGPQVLALDSLLNIEVRKNYSLAADQKFVDDKPVVNNNAVLFPNLWIGKQAFIFNVADKKNNAKQQQLVLIPFADASQTGGDMKVWLPFDVKK